jgi:drug/metabolite transporter (DMT)-like permease
MNFSALSMKGLSANLRGIILMVVSTVGFAAMHAAVRHLSGELHPFEIVFFRNAFGLLALAPWFLRYGLAPLRTRHLPLHGLRAGFNIFAMSAYFYALSITPLAQVTSLSFTVPLFATLLAMVVLGEVVRVRRWIAIFFGLVGTLVILRPGLAEIDQGLLLALSSAALWACALTVIKVLSRTDSSVTITCYMVLLMAPISLVPALWVWQWPTGQQLLWLVAIGVVGTLGQLVMTQALKEAETSVIMPFDFFRLIWATLLGFLFFAEIPTFFTWIGAGIIFASSSYIAYREHKVTRAPPPQSVARPPEH